MTPEFVNEEIKRMEWFEAAIAEIEATGELSLPPMYMFGYEHVDTIKKDL